MITEGDEQNPLNLGSNFGETFNIWITSFFPGNPTSSLHALRRHPLNKSPVMVSCIKAIKAREIYNDAFSGYDKLTQVSV